MIRNCVILGAAESGIGAAILAKKLGWKVFVSDKSSIKPAFLQILESNQIPYESGLHTIDQILAADLIIKSPGIPESAPVIQSIRKQGIELISEIEFAYRYRNPDSNIIAITGSNGKTTTTRMIYEMLKEAGFDVGLGGNIGFSFAKMVAENPHAWYVLEISSFQLDDVVEFHPHVAVITNIYQNHLDRYENDWRKYAAAKLNLVKNQTEEDYFIHYLESEWLSEAIENCSFVIRSQKLGYSLSYTPETNAFINQEEIIININSKIMAKDKEKTTVGKKDLKVKGNHNYLNAMASAITGKVLGIRKENIRSSMEKFENSEHRIEKVKMAKGVIYYNDSKSTNVNATWFALETMTRPTVWIAGGVDKGNDYKMLIPMAKEKVKAMVLLGRDIAKIEEAFRDSMAVIRIAQTMEEAVQMASELASPGDNVLLSPMCASFDLFENYEARGNAFKNEVLKMEVFPTDIQDEELEKSEDS